MIDLFGYVGGILLAFCGLPEAYRAYKNKRCDIGKGMLSMWFVGEICLFLYVLPNRDIPLLMNYLTNILLLSILIWYKIFPKDIC